MLLLVTDFSDGHFYECHSNQWSGPWGWVLLHDLSLLGAWVWRSCRGTVLPGNLCSILHVHHRISGNSRGKMNLGINWELFCLITSTLEFQYLKKKQYLKYHGCQIEFEVTRTIFLHCHEWMISVSYWWKEIFIYQQRKLNTCIIWEKEMQWDRWFYHK